MKSSKKKAKKAPAKKVVPKKASSKKPSKVAPKKAPAKKTSKRPAPKKAPAKKAKPAKKQAKVAKKAAKVVAKPAKKVAKKAKAAPKKSLAKKVANTERKRHPAKPKPAKKAKTAKKSAPKTKPAKKVAKKGRSKDSASAPSLSPALPHRGGRYAPNPSSRRGEKKAAKVVAKPAKKVAKSEKKAKKEKVKGKPAEFFRPPKRGATGALIISKRGRKSKKERAAAEAQSIFVPRDVKAENTEENQIRDARAYSPDELEQLLMSRGVSNMNVFDPKTASTAKVEYRAEATPCHTERKRHLAKEKKQKKVILTTLPKAKKRQTVGPVSVSDLFGFNPFAKNSASQEEKLIPEKWRKYYRKLIERKDALLARLNEHSEKAFQKEGKEETGDVSAYSQHTADIDNDAFDRDLALSRLPAEQEELSEINIAIDRMKKGTYGICEITGKPIPAERLNKVPFTRYSLEGKLEAEKQRGLAARRRRANATGDISEVIDLENDAPVQLPEEENEEQ